MLKKSEKRLRSGGEGMCMKKRKRKKDVCECYRRRKGEEDEGQH